MRVMRTDNFGNYVTYEQVPGWMIAENYNFCDEFVDSKYAEKKNGFFGMLMSVLHAAF